MRERFGDWGAELSNEDFACALAAAGLIGPEADPRWPAEILFDHLWSRWKGLRPWALTRAARRFDAGTLARAWRLWRGPVEIVLSVRLPGIEPSWLSEQLSLAGARVMSIDLDDDSFFRTSPDRSILRKPSGAYSVEVPEEAYRGRGREEETEEGQARYLQARVQLEQQVYWVFVRIGLPDDLWAALPEPFPSLSATETYQLTVIFWEPKVSPEPQIQRLWLPPRGNSEEVHFSFRSADGPEPIAARITVLHNNRVLQTGLLRSRKGRWTFSLDATPRTRLEGLSARSQFDAALVLNHDDGGTARLTAAAGDEAAVIPISESSVNGLTRALSEQISKIAATPERYQTLRSEGTQELLLTLAQKGGGLHRTLSKLFKLNRLVQPESTGRLPRIHLTSALPDSFFPAEFLYRFQVPEDTARLCEHALTGLAAGACPPACPSDKSGTVCPLGFWGLCSVIERHSYRGEHEKPSTGFHLRPEPVQKRSELDISGKALLAASDAASKHEKGAVQGLLQKLRGRGPAELVTSWKDWSARLATDRPTLLVLLPHHQRKGSFEVLEIGNSDPLKSELIEDVKHVRINEQDKPIVLLMGCDTNLARIAFDNFVTRFIAEGAAIVVSTIATILGRHASPATARLIELLDEEAREGDSTFGEVMLRLRQSLVASETPMALGLTAYGDADWILTRKG